MWGNDIWACATFSPEKYDLCAAATRYLKRFPQGEYVDYLTNKNFCAPKKTVDVKIIDCTYVNDIFSLLDKIGRKRLWIDLWATWCAPCKMEFKNYDDNLLNYFKANKVEPVFISIDEPENRDKWEKAIKALNLKGTHVLVNEALMNSIKEVVFDNKPVSIPRYVYVNEKGQIISTDAIRPSDGNFKTKFEKLMTR